MTIPRAGLALGEVLYRAPERDDRAKHEAFQLIGLGVLVMLAAFVVLVRVARRRDRAAPPSTATEERINE